MADVGDPMRIFTDFEIQLLGDMINQLIVNVHIPIMMLDKSRELLLATADETYLLC